MIRWKTAALAATLLGMMATQGTARRLMHSSTQALRAITPNPSPALETRETVLTPQASLPLPLIQRGGTVAVKVANYDAARLQVMESARMQGAELLEATTVVNPKGAKHGWVSFSIPAERVGAFLPVAHGLGKLYSEHMTAANNDSEHDMLARRVGSLQQHETRLAGVLQSPRRMRGSDILYLQERLFRANVDEGMLRQQRIDLERNARVSTVTVEMFEPGAIPATTDDAHIDLRQWFAASALRAREGLGRQLARAATAGAYAAVYAPLWVPCLIAALVILAWIWRRRRIAVVLLRRTGTALVRLAVLWWARREERITRSE